MKQPSKKKRTLVDLPGETLKKIDQLADNQEVSRASVLRDAVAEYVIKREQTPDAIRPLQGFGALRGYFPEGQSYQDALRKEWE